MGVSAVLLAVLAIAGGVLYRNRVRDYVGRRRDVVDDDMIRRIESQGTVDVEDPIDMDEVRREEERFWSETWDRPEES